MNKQYWNYSTQILVVSLVVQKCHTCSDDSPDDSACWYKLWYIWFVLSLFVIVIAVLVILYIKHRTKERTRQRRRRRSTRTVPIHIVPAQPPAYAEPSHKPPSYEEAILHPSNTVPGIIPNNNDDYRYRPPPTSMRMVSNIPAVPTTPLPQPPSYADSIQGQGHISSTQGQGHPV